MIYSAAMPKRSLRFLLYSIHGHLATGVPDYPALIRSLVSLRGYHHEEGNRQAAIGTAMLLSNRERLFVVAYTGDKEKSTLYFDLAENHEFVSQNQPNQFAAKKTYIMIDAVKRRLVIEAGRGCLLAEELAKIIQDEAGKKPEFASLELSFTPVAAPAFMDKIRRMERIQSATVSIARPNVDWSDNYEELAKLADQSEGGAIETTVRAKRGKSLSKVAGIIPNIQHWLSDRLSAVASAKVKGAVRDDSGLITLKLSDYVDTLNVSVDAQPDSNQPTPNEVQNKLSTYLNSQENPPDATPN